jgi:DNA-binding response OmpR family regulator
MADALRIIQGDGGEVPAYERIPLRRPRFTMSEVLIINELVNKSPEPVTLRRLHKILSGYSARPYPITDEAIKTHIANLRAKIGEVSRRPTALVTTHVERPTGDPELAYFFRED